MGKFAAPAGVNASAIRYYEKRGLLPPPQRTGNQRRYPSDTLYRVLLIRFATDMGFTLSEIKLFLNGLVDNTPVGPRCKKLPTRKILTSFHTLARSHRLRSLL